MNLPGDDDDDGTGSELQIREVYAYFGRAAYAASCLEHGLTIALMKAELMAQVAGRARRERKAPSADAWQAMFDDYMAKHDKLPLGTLIQRFRSVVTTGPDLDALLDEALAVRNFLAHGFFRERAIEFAHEAGRDDLIEELDGYHGLLMRADDTVQNAVAHVFPRLGIDVEKMEAESQAIIRAQLEAARAKTRS